MRTPPKPKVRDGMMILELADCVSGRADLPGRWVGSYNVRRYSGKRRVYKALGKQATWAWTKRRKG